MPALSAASAALHRDLVVVDGHCDTALLVSGLDMEGRLAAPFDLNARNGFGHVDAPRLLEGGVTAQFFALFTDTEYVARAREHTYGLLSRLEAALDGSDSLRPARRAADVLAAKRDGKTAAFLAVEGGEAIGESLDELRSLYARGVRLMGLTWNRMNALGRGADHPGPDGLTPFGLSVVAEMERLGMIVDASHLCDQALAELLAVARRPVVASHSNARAVVDHRRNLTDAQAEGIAATGGLVAVTFAGLFVDPEPAKVSVDRVVDHIDRLVSAVGADHVGLGSDFDGFTPAYGLVMPDCSRLPELTARLVARGYAAPDVRKIMGGNWLRVMAEVLG